eukprot:gene8737-biopygen9190
MGETAEDASGTRPFLQMPSCGPRPVRVRCRFPLSVLGREYTTEYGQGGLGGVRRSHRPPLLPAAGKSNSGHNAKERSNVYPLVVVGVVRGHVGEGL